jgi:hypothetical protein
MAAGDPVPGADIARRAELALAEVLARTEHEGVYASPAWPIGGEDPSRAGLHGWKRAILRRNPRGGAEHWGHLFFLDGPSEQRWDLAAAGGPLADRRGRPPRRLAEWVGSGRRIEVWVRPSTPGTDERLSALAGRWVTTLRAGAPAPG